MHGRRTFLAWLDEVYLPLSVAALAVLVMVQASKAVTLLVAVVGIALVIYGRVRGIRRL